MQLRGTALVTGASSGLGQAMAQALLEAGMEVLAAARPTPRLTSTVRSWRAQGLRAHEAPVDVRDPQSVQQLADWVGERFGALDLLCNNAGIGMRTVNPQFMTDPRPFFEVPPEGFDDVVRTNLTGYFLISRAFAPTFVRRRQGRIVNVSMNLETMQRRGFVPYGPARAGAEALSRIMAEDLRPFGVTVNQLLPGGATLTGMIPDGFPADRLLQPEVMGRPIVFLASPEAQGLTGARILATEFEEWHRRFMEDRAR